MVFEAMPRKDVTLGAFGAQSSRVRSKSLTLVLASQAHTISLGRLIGKLLTGGHVLALIGDLGAGKTTLVRGIAAGMGADPHGVSSPTFVLAHEYQGRLPLYHLDLYRLGGAAEAEEIGFSEFFTEGSSVVIEWADRVTAMLPQDRLEIRLVHGQPSARRASLVALGPRSSSLLSRIEMLGARRRGSSPAVISKFAPPRKAGRR